MTSEHEGAPVEEPPSLSVDFEAAEKPPTQGPDTEPPASIEMEEPPEKSASERLFEQIMELPSDERNAALSALEKRLEEKGEADTLPWRQRMQDEMAKAKEAASQNAERERRQAEIRSWQTNSEAARANLDWLVNDLNERWEKRDLGDPAPRMDMAEFTKHRDDYANAQAALLSHGAITEIGNAMNDGLMSHGGPMTEDELTAITRAVSRGDKVRAYMDALAKRVEKEVSEAMERDIDKRIRAAVDAEKGAIRAEVLSGLKVAPEQKPAGVGASKGYLEMTTEERNKLSAEERDKLVAALAE